MAASAANGSQHAGQVKPTSAAQSWSAQLKPKKKTGDEKSDRANESNFVLLQGAVRHCDDYPDDIVHMSSFLSKLKKGHEQDASARQTLSVTFPQWCTLKNLPEDFVMDWIIRKSDLDASDLKKAREVDEDSSYILASAATQIPLSFKLPPDLNSVQIMTTFMDFRFEQTGKRIENFKAEGRLLTDYSLCFKDFSFKLTFKAPPSKELENIGHASLGANVVQSPGAWATTESDYENFWDDFGASIKLKGMPKVLLHSFFTPTANVPKFGYPPCSVKNPQFKADVLKCVQIHVEKAAAVKVPDAPSPLKAVIPHADREAAKDKMKSVHEQMQVKVAERKAKANFQLVSHVQWIQQQMSRLLCSLE